MKKLLMAAAAALVSLTMLAGCGGAASSVTVSSSKAASSEAVAQTASSAVDAVGGATVYEGTLRVAGLKGPTTMGMVKLMEDVENKTIQNDYQVEMFGTPDEIVTKLMSGEIDAAAVPANLASVLYNKTQGGVQVAAINTVGVLYVLETGESVKSVEDLRGKTIYSTGKGTTPEFALNYILKQNGIDPATDVTIEYKTEATEVAAMLGAGTDAIAVLPQPYVTAVQMQNDAVRVALNLTEEWDKVSVESSMVTGVLLVRTAYAQENSGLFYAFLNDYKASIAYTGTDVAAAAELVAKFGIVEKAPIAEKALPACNIVYIDGDEMHTKLGGYLQVLHEQNPESVGGSLPGDDFYYTPKKPDASQAPESVAASGETSSSASSETAA